MTEEEAVRQAEAEGLMLLKADNVSGYKHVTFDRHYKTKPHQAQVWRGGKHVFLGAFATAEEAALAHLRTPDGGAGGRCGSASAGGVCVWVARWRREGVGGRGQPLRAHDRKLLTTVAGVSLSGGGHRVRRWTARNCSSDGVLCSWACLPLDEPAAAAAPTACLVAAPGAESLMLNVCSGGHANTLCSSWSFAILCAPAAATEPPADELGGAEQGGDRELQSRTSLATALEAAPGPSSLARFNMTAGTVASPKRGRPVTTGKTEQKNEGGQAESFREMARKVTR